eukprot:386245_1
MPRQAMGHAWSASTNSHVLLIHITDGDVGCGNLALERLLCFELILALKDVLAILVQFELDDLNIGWVHTNLRRGSVSLIPGNLVNVDHPTTAVDASHLAIATLVQATFHTHLILLADGYGAHVIFAAQLLRQRGTHEDAPYMRRCCEVRLTGLPPTATAGGCPFHQHHRVQPR